MDSDQEMEDVEMPALPSFAKGKGKATDKGHDYDDNLPWYIHSFISELPLKPVLG